MGTGEFVVSSDRSAASRTMGSPFSLWPDTQLSPPPPKFGGHHRWSMQGHGKCIFLYLHPNDSGGVWSPDASESEFERRWASTRYGQKRSIFSPPTPIIWLPAWRPSSLSAISHLRGSVAGCHHHAIRSAPRQIAEVFSSKNITKGDLFSFSR
jgi:hypothetical protein